MKDMAAHTMTGERGMMVAMSHGLCVCFCVCRVTTKNRLDLKKPMHLGAYRLHEVSNC